MIDIRVLHCGGGGIKPCTPVSQGDIQTLPSSRWKRKRHLIFVQQNAQAYSK
jgi:hypothetical protein